MLLRENLPRLNHPTLPSFLPTRTNELAEGYDNHLTIVGIELRNIVRSNRKGVPYTFDNIASPRALRSFLRVSEVTKVVAILNGFDCVLENLWRMDRNRLFQSLKAGGIIAITGPTFSVIDESRKNLASHNVIMQLRHNRIVREAWKAGIPAYPNIYWRSKSDIIQWADMINESSSIPAIYRDFTLARPQAVFEPQFDELLYLLRMIVRPVHIIVTGIGMRRVTRVTVMLASSGYSYTIVSPEPIIMAISSGKRLQVNDDGSVLGIQDLGIKRQELALLNLEVFTQLCNMHSKL